jgi:hypothetical protein
MFDRGALSWEAEPGGYTFHTAIAWISAVNLRSNPGGGDRPGRLSDPGNIPVRQSRERRHTTATPNGNADCSCAVTHGEAWFIVVNAHAGMASSPMKLTIALLAAGLLAAGAGNPAFVTSDPNGGWVEAGYYVHNNMWNSAKYSPCTSTLSALSHEKWQVVERMNNKSGDGAVKTYPNVHKDYASVPIRSFDAVASSFAESSPHVGIYNVAYDIWINGIARAGCTEIMIWTENFNQVPGGKHVQDVTFGTRTYQVYKRPGSSGYIAFVATTNFNSGTLDLLGFMKWAIHKGWLPSASTLNQICFGVETVSTDDADAKFQVTAFSIDANLRTVKL